MAAPWPHKGGYKGGPAVGPQTLPRPLYPPDSKAKGKTPSRDGPDILAWKRGMKRAQVWAKSKDLNELDDSFTNVFSHGGSGEQYGPGVEGFQRNQGLDASGWVGDKTYQNARHALVPSGPNKGQPIFDDESVSLLYDAWDMFGGKEPPPGDPKDVIRGYLVEFCEKGLKNGSKWTYTQNRAVDPSIDPAGYVKSDCSGSVIQAYNYAKRMSGFDVPDPAKYSYAGWGNTWDDEDGHPKVGSPYEIGDLAHYDGHVCMCMKAGNSDTADWWSFGSEPPSKRKLHYRTDFKFVVRPPLI